jgi:GNAT superfamily N-acetyltransferase
LIRCRSRPRDSRIWITAWNENPKPFIWTKTADQSRRSFSRACTPTYSSWINQVERLFAEVTRDLERSRQARPAGHAETEILRPATVADAAELLVLQRACWSREAIDNDSFQIPALHEELDDVLAWLDDWETWVLRRGPRLIGAVRGQSRGTDWEVGRLMVAPDLAGGGIGRRLLEHIEAQAPDPVTRFVLYTGALSARNIRLYERAGYSILTGDDELLPAIPITVRLTKARH